jgi:hypothetical protein
MKNRPENDPVICFNKIHGGMKNHLLFLLLGACVLITTCKKDTIDPVPESDSEEGQKIYSGDHEENSDYTWDASSEILIELAGNSINANDTGVIINGSIATITRVGNYRVQGSLSDGQLIVNVQGKGKVRLILDGAHITCLTSSPLLIEDTKKLILVLAENSINELQDGSNYVFASSGENEPNAALFSKSDLTIFGEGSLTVLGNYRDGITSKDGLIIKSGTLTITAKDDGIRGKDYLIVKEGKLTVNAGGDGLKSDNEDDVGRGYLAISSGILGIKSGGDALSSVKKIRITGGNIDLLSGGGSSIALATGLSAKGIKAGDSLIIDEGTISVNSSDDAIHSNGMIALNGGILSLSSGDDGVHSEINTDVNGGDITISNSYEGLESTIITINAGNIHINSSDDGVNVGTGAEPGQMSPGSSTSFLYLNGAYLVVNANGDGIDINGSIVMTAGTVLVNGPVQNDNGALDYDVTFDLSGGFIVAAGSSGMAMAPGTTSTVNSLLLNFTASQKAGTLVNIQNSEGTSLLTFAPAKTYQSIEVTMPSFITGSQYTVYTGGSSTGTLTDGLYEGGSYTPGTKYTSFTISSPVTKIGNTNGGGPGPHP